VSGAPSDAEDRWTLAKLIRDYLDLTETKTSGSIAASVGACRVHLDGVLIDSCRQVAAGAPIHLATNQRAAKRWPK
jgi:aerobic-type carbon monoxide dehydrogenase small subunit (CoxS/CutS family)